MKKTSFFISAPFPISFEFPPTLILQDSSPPFFRVKDFFYSTPICRKTRNLPSTGRNFRFIFDGIRGNLRMPPLGPPPHPWVAGSFLFSRSAHFSSCVPFLFERPKAIKLFTAIFLFPAGSRQVFFLSSCDRRFFFFPLLSPQIVTKSPPPFSCQSSFF